MVASIKVLAIGSAYGSIRDLFAKIKTIDAKHGKFDFSLCIGDFFGPLKDLAEGSEDEVSMLLDGKLEVPIECYIMQGESPLPDSVIQKFAKTGGELCKNVFLMSKSGLITTANGLRIACLAGTYEQNIYSTADSTPGFASPFFSAQSVDRLLANTLTTSSSKQDYKSLAAIQASSSSSQLVDILISNVWPASITNFSSAPLPFPELRSIGAPPLDDVCKRLKPRYHFAASGGQPPAFWEREPFVWDDESGRALRFISLGAFGGPPPTSSKKQRWFYAFSIAPYAPEAPTSAPANSTRNPFAEIAARKRGFQQASEGENYIFGDVRQPGKRIRIENTGPPGKPPPGYKCRRCDSTEHFINDCPERQKPPEGYVCRLCNTAGHLVRDCPTKHAVGDTGGRKPKEGYVCRACGSEAHYLDDCPVANQRHPGGGDGERRGGKRGPPKEIGRDECWFCLSNPNLAKHLIVAIGEECYLTLPKGQIIPTQSFGGNNADVPGGGHILIVPITHYPTFNTIPSDLASPIIDETEKYKSSLRQLYAKYKHEPVFFEVARVSAKGGHAHVQVVPIPSRIKSKDVEEAFLSQGRSQGVDFDAGDDAQEALASCAGGRSGYFRVDLPDGKKLVHVMKPHVPFNLQFGRQVLVDLLGWPNRLDWKACGLTEDEEKADAQAFKTAFAPFTS